MAVRKTKRVPKCCPQCGSRIVVAQSPIHVVHYCSSCLFVVEDKRHFKKLKYSRKRDVITESGKIWREFTRITIEEIGQEL